MKLTVRDAAEMFGVPEGTVYRWIEEGSIPVYKLRDQHRFSRSELLEWGTAQGLSLSPALLREHEASARGSLPRIAEGLARGGVYFAVPGETRESALRAVVSRLPLPDEVDQEFLYDILVAREAVGSTGIGDGIALPHVRSPIVLHVEEPLVSLCYLEKAVDFGALDGKPVHTIFTLVTPTVRTHLHLLARLALLLRNSGFHDAVMAKTSPEVLLRLARDLESSVLRGAQGGGS
ncbi:MAG: PTS sugar transporter subunit IIA [Acidobacteria bacterium]|nr:PTS sugar transporter subunit IIA [Acidobacteriota bacterium]MCG3195310.1 hypothetical protein [Thermoanaerobaculia bacterium]